MIKKWEFNDDDDHERSSLNLFFQKFNDGVGSGGVGACHHDGRVECSERVERVEKSVQRLMACTNFVFGLLEWKCGLARSCVFNAVHQFCQIVL